MKKIVCFVTAGLVLLCACTSENLEHSDAKPLEEKTPVVNEPAPLKDSIRYDSYCNQRYHYCIDYPKDYLIPQGESGSGDGQAFISADKANRLLAYRDLRDNIDPDVKFKLETAYQEDLKDENIKEVTYKKLGQKFYVISGYNKKGNIFYQKRMLSDGQLITCLLEYRMADKDIFSRISEHVFHSFE
jgi:hypothetical protein